MQDVEQYGRRSLWLDLSDVMNNSMLGVHAATMGGTWQALVFGFMGVRFTDSGPQTDLHASDLPAGWEGIKLALTWRGRAYTMEVGRT